MDSIHQTPFEVWQKDDPKVGGACIREMKDSGASDMLLMLGRWEHNRDK